MGRRIAIWIVKISLNFRKATNDQMEKVVCRMNGGLGNQLFQFSMGKVVSDQAGAELWLDLTGLAHTKKRGISTPRDFQLELILRDARIASSSDLEHWGLKTVSGEGYSRLSTLRARGHWHSSKMGIMPQNYFRDADSFSEIAASESRVIYLAGFWGNRAEHELARGSMQELVSSSVQLSPRLQRIADCLLESNSVAVHVRRGDYLSASVVSHNALDEAYFRQALENVGVGPDRVFFFSDDPEWCQSTFHDISGAEFVEPTGNETDFMHLVCMSKASSLVISNSTFSWWAAYLSNVAKEVFYPAGYGRNLSQPFIPVDWKEV